MLIIWCQTYWFKEMRVLQSFSHWCWVLLNKVVEFKCNTYIILGYFHSPWNLEGYCIALPNLKIIQYHTILWQYLNHGTNEGVVKLVTLMVKGNETITKMRVLQLHIKNLLENLIPLMWPILQYLHVHIYTNDFALVDWTILIIYELKISFNYI